MPQMARQDDLTGLDAGTPVEQNQAIRIRTPTATTWVTGSATMPSACAPTATTRPAGVTETAGALAGSAALGEPQPPSTTVTSAPSAIRRTTDIRHLRLEPTRRVPSARGGIR